MAHKSTIIIEQEGQWFVARSLELGVTSQGRTMEEAEKNIKEAVDLYLEDQPSKKRQLPRGIPHITWLEV